MKVKPMRGYQMLLGDGLCILAMLVWLAVAVGPWQLALGLFFGAIVVNTIQLWFQR